MSLFSKGLLFGPLGPKSIPRGPQGRCIQGPPRNTRAHQYMNATIPGRRTIHNLTMFQARVGGNSMHARKNTRNNTDTEAITQAANHSPLTTHHSPLTTHHTPHTTHHSPLATHHTQHATRRVCIYIYIYREIDR